MTAAGAHTEDDQMTTISTAVPGVQAEPAEVRFDDELAFLRRYDQGARPPHWNLTPAAVVTFIMGNGGAALSLPKGVDPEPGGAGSIVISDKFVGDRALVERCVVTLAGERGLLLVGEPGTAKSMLSELLSAAICGTSALTVQGTAGTTEDQLRYGWNYALLLAQGPSPEALVPSPVLTAMRRGAVARVEEITRCLPEVQDALVSILSDRRMAVPELAGLDGATVHQSASPARVHVIATANLRDQGRLGDVGRAQAPVQLRGRPADRRPATPRSPSSAARPRPRVERVGAPTSRSTTRCSRRWSPPSATCAPAARSRAGSVERPSTVMSTAEAVAVGDVARAGRRLLRPATATRSRCCPGHLLGVVRKDDPADAGPAAGLLGRRGARRAEAEPGCGGSSGSCAVLERV